MILLYSDSDLRPKLEGTVHHAIVEPNSIVAMTVATTEVWAVRCILLNQHVSGVVYNINWDGKDFLTGVLYLSARSWRELKVMLSTKELSRLWLVAGLLAVAESYIKGQRPQLLMGTNVMSEDSFEATLDVGRAWLALHNIKPVEIQPNN